MKQGGKEIQKHEHEPTKLHFRIPWELTKVRTTSTSESITQITTSTTARLLCFPSLLLWPNPFHSTRRLFDMIRNVRVAFQIECIRLCLLCFLLLEFSQTTRTILARSSTFDFLTRRWVRQDANGSRLVGIGKQRSRIRDRLRGMCRPDRGLFRSRSGRGSFGELDGGAVHRGRGRGRGR